MRQVVHSTFAVDAVYAAPGEDAAPPVSLSVRFHTKRLNPFGDIGGEGYAVVIENADRAIFDIDELTAKAVTPEIGGAINFTEYGLVFTLGVRDPNAGPAEQIWTLVR
jgi:hypothetical protein